MVTPCGIGGIPDEAFAGTLPVTSVKRNIFANYLGSGTVALAPIFALPWYLGILGPGQFGLIGIIITLQAVLGLLDAGMSQALIREFSVRLGLVQDAQRKTAELLLGFERVYWGFAVALALVTMLFAGLIASHWLNLGDLPVSLGELAVYGASALFAVQFPGSIYRSMLVAGQAQLSLNVIMSAAALLRHAGAVLVLFVWPTLLAYLCWHLAIGLLETILRRYYAWRCLTVSNTDVSWMPSVLKTTWALVAGMSAATWLGALTVQMDKIVLSRMVPIDQFGYYVIAASIAGGVLQLVYPLVQAVLPRAIQLRNEPDALLALSLKLCKAIGTVVLLGAIGFVFAGHWLLGLWLGNPEAEAIVFPLLAILLTGTVLNAFYNVGYINWIAHEKIRRVLQVNATAFGLSVVLIPLLVYFNGSIGAAFGWIIINLIGFVLSLEWLRRKE